ncbi:uncharacterized protein LOC136033360 [Artemia franciscana]|uniref:uncharacterized protein LOC136033360 n=1 Tax=Artemia franciscana TaxID=6661 RepID=UPI0032DA9ED7
MPNDITFSSDDENKALLEKSRKIDKSTPDQQQPMVLLGSQQPVSDNPNKLEKNFLNVCTLRESEAIKRHQIRKFKGILGKTGRQTKFKTKIQTRIPLFYPNLSWVNGARRGLSREIRNKSDAKLLIQRDGMAPKHDSSLFDRSKQAALSRLEEVKCGMKRCAISDENLRNFKIPKLNTLKTGSLVSEGLTVRDSESDLTQSGADFDSNKISVYDLENQFLVSRPPVPCIVVDKKTRKFDNYQESSLNLRKITIDYCENNPTNSQANVIWGKTDMFINNPESQFSVPKPILQSNFTEDTLPKCNILKTSMLNSSLFESNYIYYDFETDKVGTWIKSVSENADKFNPYLGNQFLLLDKITTPSGNQNKTLKKLETCGFPTFNKGVSRNLTFTNIKNKNKIGTVNSNKKSKGTLMSKMRHVAEIQTGYPIPYSRNLREVVIDGANVAYRYSRRENRERLDLEGVQLVYNYFIERGHKVSVVFTNTLFNRLSKDPKMGEIFKAKAVVFTPHINQEGFNQVVLDDDRFIIQLAAQKQGVIITGDFFRDSLSYAIDNHFTDWVDTITLRLLIPTFATGIVLFDPLPYGPQGPPLSAILKF